MWKLSQGQAREPASVTSSPPLALIGYKTGDRGPRGQEIGDVLICHQVNNWMAFLGTSPFLRAENLSTGPEGNRRIWFYFYEKKTFKEASKHFEEWISLDVLCITSV